MSFPRRRESTNNWVDSRLRGNDNQKMRWHMKGLRKEQMDLESKVKSFKADFFGEEILTRLEVVRVGTSSIELAFTAHVGGELAAHGTYILVQSPIVGEGSKPWPADWKKAFLGE